MNIKQVTENKIILHALKDLAKSVDMSTVSVISELTPGIDLVTFDQIDYIKGRIEQMIDKYKARNKSQTLGKSN